MFDEKIKKWTTIVFGIFLYYNIHLKRILVLFIHGNCQFTVVVYGLVWSKMISLHVVLMKVMGSGTGQWLESQSECCSHRSRGQRSAVSVLMARGTWTVSYPRAPGAARDSLD